VVHGAAMEILDGDVLYELIFRRYSKNPRGWSFTVSPSSSHGFFDALVQSPEEAWQLKFDTIFKPSPLVLGASTNIQSAKRRQSRPMQFGFRELDRSLRAEIENGGGRSNKLAAFLASMDPVVPKRGGSYAEGPFVLAPASKLDRTQSKLDERLSSEMRKLFQRRYPGYG
jgi:hypothetical protein